MSGTETRLSATSAFKVTCAIAATLAFAGRSSAQASGSAEAQVRLYAALAGATNNVVDQLLGLDPIKHNNPKPDNPSKGVDTYILFDPRMSSDMTLAATFKTPLDSLYYAIYPHKHEDNSNKGHETIDVKNYSAPLPTTVAALAGVSLPGIIATLGSIAGISPALFAQTTAQSAASGPADADAFVAAQLIARFKQISGKNNVPMVSVYTPSIFPLLTSSTPNLKSLSNSTAGGTQYGPDNTDPVTEFTLLQSDVAFLLRSEQDEILMAFTNFSKETAPIAGTSTAATPNVAAAYTTLVNDLKAAIAWLPPVAIGAPGSVSPTGVGSPTAALPYASIQADIQLLNATLAKYKGLNDAELYKHLRGAVRELTQDLPPAPSATSSSKPPLSSPQTNLLDSTIQIAEALSSIGGALSTSVSPYGTVTSTSPGAATPTTIGYIVTRGWQITELLNTNHCKVLRIHLEVAQGTDKTTSYAVKWFKDSSAMALLSFMVLDKPTDGDFATVGLDLQRVKLPKNGESPEVPSPVANHTDNIKFASWSLAYYPFQNGHDALNLDHLQILCPEKFNSSGSQKPPSSTSSG